MSPPIVSENVSLSGKIRIQHIQHRITHRLMLFTSFILVIAEEELKWDHQAPSGSSSLCRLGKLYYSRGSGRAVHRQKLSGLSADRNTFFIFLLLPSSSSKSGWGNFSFEAKEPTRLAPRCWLSLQKGVSQHSLTKHRVEEGAQEKEHQLISSLSEVTSTIVNEPFRHHGLSSHCPHGQGSHVLERPFKSQV